MRYTLPITAVAALLLGAPTPLAAQSQDVRAQLIERGAPTEFADQVAQIVSNARAEQLPTEPLVSKALEGWAKRARVPQARVIAVLNQSVERLRTGHEIGTAAGMNPPSGPVVAAAADALGRGLSREQVRSMMGEAAGPEAAATGLTVASALVAQGLDTEAAVRVVGDAFRDERPPEEILEFPSAVTGLRAQGQDMSEIARQIMQGGGLPSPTAPGMGGRGTRPQGVPGMTGAGQKKKKGNTGGQ
ncbi:MAG: hypothetical protein JSW51_02440 [Gemmatimonadota bacterium]|nr:MAG: hypothetical protein JSW51_02440 [Gemmatimonadota bacterium]